VVERRFRELTDKALRRGAFHSVPDLISAIEGYLAAHNDDAQAPGLDGRQRNPSSKKSARGRVALQALNQN
jgi:hypothetical protein